MDEAVCAILIRDGKTLLGLRAADKKTCPNRWDTVGGSVKKGETSAEALRREVKEEIGISVRMAEECRSVSEWRKRWGGPVIYRIYWVREWKGRIRRLGDEHTALRWFSLKEVLALPKLGHPIYREILPGLPGLE